MLGGIYGPSCSLARFRKNNGKEKNELLEINACISTTVEEGKSCLSMHVPPRFVLAVRCRPSLLVVLYAFWGVIKKDMCGNGLDFFVSMKCL
jgi:hypothetical protein